MYGCLLITRLAKKAHGRGWTRQHWWGTAKIEIRYFPVQYRFTEQVSIKKNSLTNPPKKKRKTAFIITLRFWNKGILGWSARERFKKPAGVLI